MYVQCHANQHLMYVTVECTLDGFISLAMARCSSQTHSARGETESGGLLALCGCALAHPHPDSAGQSNPPCRTIYSDCRVLCINTSVTV